MALASRTDPWVEVGGTHKERLATATAAIDALILSGPSDTAGARGGMKVAGALTATVEG